MEEVFRQTDIKKIAKALGVPPKYMGNNYRFVLKDEEKGHHISLEIYPSIPIGDQIGNLITVYTPSSHLQLQFCTRYVVSDMLGEVTFVSECGDRISGLIVEKPAGCSLYANVDAKLLSGDFTKLGPEVMLSGIALSIAEYSLHDEDDEG